MQTSYKRIANLAECYADIYTKVGNPAKATTIILQCCCLFVGRGACAKSNPLRKGSKDRPSLG